MELNFACLMINSDSVQQRLLRMLCVGLLCCGIAMTRAGAQNVNVVPPTSGPVSLAQSASEQIDQWNRVQQDQLRRNARDWAALFRYGQANEALHPPASDENRVVFYGDSITDAWVKVVPEFFADKPYLDRGISGQTTPQMLVRFRQDVVALHPSIVVILAGTNDIAQNAGPTTLGMIEDNFQSMVEIARANGITSVLASVLPAIDYGWRRGLEPASKIVALNAWLKDYAIKNHLVYLDYYAAMVDEHGGLRPELAADNPGIHPNKAGYEVMGPLAEKAIAQALRERP